MGEGPVTRPLAQGGKVWVEAELADGPGVDPLWLHRGTVTRSPREKLAKSGGVTALRPNQARQGSDGSSSQRALSQPSSPSDHGTAVPRLKISSSASSPGHTPILSLSG
jgi:hypothetical protein